MIGFLIGMVVGSIFGIILMCLLQVNRMNGGKED